MWMSVSFARSVADFDAWPALTIMLFNRFLRSSNIRSDTHSVSSIFSDWLANNVDSVSECPV